MEHVHTHLRKTQRTRTRKHVSALCAMPLQPQLSHRRRRCHPQRPRRRLQQHIITFRNYNIVQVKFIASCLVSWCLFACVSRRVRLAFVRVAGETHKTFTFARINRMNTVKTNCRAVMMAASLVPHGFSLPKTTTTTIETTMMVLARVLYTSNVCTHALRPGFVYACVRSGRSKPTSFSSYVFMYKISVNKS